MNKEKLKQIIKSLDTAPLKKRGQHFLISDKVVSDLVGAASLSKKDKVLEIGPGLGALTEKLVEQARKVLACEVDDKLISYLQNKYQQENIEILKADILRLDLAKYFENNKYKVVANIPYYLTSHLFKFFLENKTRPELMAFLVQKEIADRLTAEAPNVSLLTLSVQLYAETKIISVVPSEAFYPAPKVDSAVILLKLRQTPLIAETLIADFFHLAKIAFAAKRKQIHNNLESGLKWEKDKIIQLLKISAIDKTRRAETLTWPEWESLTRKYIRIKKDPRLQA
ncbi:MAG: 16S rRNA (adenine(1518)-N(6)/adenine(1519)-N(6))-dimethyltransferase RsmA [bacterium]